MALILTEEQELLRDSARTFLQERAPVSHLRELRDTGNEAACSLELWAEMADMGWAAMLVPEAFGGLDYGYLGMGLVLQECGRTLTPSPLISTALTAVTALRLAGTGQQCEQLLPGIATGETVVALACDESSRHLPHQSATRAKAEGDVYRINGKKLAVMDGQLAQHFIVTAWTGSGLTLFMVPADASGVSVSNYPVLDIHATAEVRFDQVEVPESAILGDLDGGLPLLDRILDAARIGVSAELLGIGLEAFERTMQYLRERTQFGVPIGSFQALQHRAAELFAELEMCKSVVLKALQMLDEENTDLAEMGSLAKAKVAETAHRATTEAIQMHGGIGMTDEFDIGFFLKRCRILEAQYGDRYYHLDRYARLRGY